MKLLPIFLLFLAPFLVKADQLQWLSKKDAQKGVDYLLTKKKVVLWCGCCTGDVKEKVKLLGAKVKHTGTENFYEVIITYKTASKEIKESAIDLAYIHFKKGKLAYCVGTQLEMECDPCTEPFSYK